MDYYTKILNAATSIRDDLARYDRGYDYVLPALDALIETIKLHEPKPFLPDRDCGLYECHGCDPGPHAEGRADAPCSTLDAIGEALEVQR
jgi:hypothetical protein